MELLQVQEELQVQQLPQLKERLVVLVHHYHLILLVEEEEVLQ